jgi:hypothetical protein
MIHIENNHPYINIGSIKIINNVIKNTDFIISNIENECKENRIHWEKSKTIKRDDEYVQMSKDIQDNNNIRQSSQINITHFAEKNNIHCQKIHSQILQNVSPLIVQYMTENNIDTKSFLEGFYLLKYKIKDKFDYHVDGLPGSTRFLSLLIYLNDSYYGGELEFNNFNLKIKPEKGSVIIFPSNFAFSHRSTSISDGTKYIITSFLNY